MSFETQLARAIKRADLHPVVELLVAADEKTRRAAFDALRRLHMESPYGSRQRAACLVALLGCGTVKDIKGLFGTEMIAPEAAAVITARPQRIADGIIRLGVEDQWSRWLWPAINRLVAQGVIDEPGHDGYLIGLLQSTASPELMGLEWRQDRPEPATAEHVAARMRREPGLVDLVFKALLIDEGPALWASGLWIEALPLLAASGDLDRDRLLDHALGGYLADLRPMSARRFGGLWKELEPTPAEARARRAVLVKMVTTHDTGAQKLGLAELTKLVKADGAGDAIDIVDACVTPLNGTQKNLASAALRLLGLLATPYPREAIAAALAGLGHPRADIQEAVLDLVAAHIDRVGNDRSLRAGLLSWGEAVAPQLRPRIAALAGVESPGATIIDVPDLAGLADAVGELPPAVVDELALREALSAVAGRRMPSATSFRPWNPAALVAGRQVARVEDTTELLEVLAAVLGGDADGIDIERALDGLARHADDPLPRRLRMSVEKHFENIIRQIGPRGFASPLIAAVQAWLSRREPAPLPFLRPERDWRLMRNRSGIAGTLVEPVVALERWQRRRAQFDGALEAANLEGMGLVRAWEVAYRCHRRDARPLLSLPSREAGWLDPGDLADRLAWYSARRASPDRFDACQAVLRLAPVASEEVVNQLTALGTPVANAALRVLQQPAAVDDEGLRRAGRIHLVTGTPVAQLKPPAAAGHAPLPTIVFPDADADAKRRRDDPVGVALAALQTPPERLSWWDTSSAILASGMRSSMAWATTMAPRFPDLLGAAVAATVIRDLNSNRTSDVDHVALGALLPPDVPLGMGAHAGLAVALVARNDALGTAAIDLLSQAASDGRLEAELLGRLLSDFSESGVVALARSGPRFMAAAEVSTLNADQCRRALEAVACHLQSVPRDIHAVLDAWLAVASQVRRGVTDEAARAYLEEMAEAGPRSKRGKLASALLELPQAWDDQTPELLALDARIARAQRWADASGSA